MLDTLKRIRDHKLDSSSDKDCCIHHPEDENKGGPSLRNSQVSHLDEKQVWLDFRKIDKNGDGRIDKNEVRSYLQSKGGKNMQEDREALVLKYFFERIDTNGDGVIDAAEWLELYEKLNEGDNDSMLDGADLTTRDGDSDDYV